jgi:hypothetical protein
MSLPVTAISPLAPKTVPNMPAIAGVRLATAAAGIRYRDRTDVMLAIFDEGTSVAGVFTRSKCPSAPVEWCRARIKGVRARALVVNSGNANAFTGKRPCRLCVYGKARRCRGRLQNQRSVSRLDRRHRRTTAGASLRRRHEQARRCGRA